MVSELTAQFRTHKNEGLQKGGKDERREGREIFTYLQLDDPPLVQLQVEGVATKQDSNNSIEDATPKLHILKIIEYIQFSLG